VAVTIYDVAKHAGVSPRTVSNVVNDYPSVSAKTRRRVQESLDFLGYRPNIMARNLRRGRTCMIAIAIPELGVSYFSELCRAIIDEVSEHSYTVLVEQTNGDHQAELEVLESFQRVHLVDGIIFNPLGAGLSDISSVAGGTPVVLLGEVAGGGLFDHVSIDNIAATREAVDHLVSIGCKRIAAIGDHAYGTGETAQLRTRGYRKALRANGRPYDSSLVVAVPRFHRDTGKEAMAHLLALPDRPDGVFCYNDLLAAGAIRAILEHGLRVPEDVAVIGFDDIEEGRYSTPTLSTISPSKAQIASRAVAQLFSRIDGDQSQPADFTAAYTLELRESTLGYQPTEAGAALAAHTAPRVTS
jgi:LacI family repressor for deo operon, udp, cdd, tsx, nupC, and nupG